MGRKKGLDSKKIIVLVSVLAQNTEGIWLRRLAREAKLSPATVNHYLNTALRPLVDDTSLGGEGKVLLKVIKLKPFVIEKLSEGRSIDDILKIIRLMDKIK